MSPFLERIKRQVERSLNCRIFRGTIPKGTDLFIDMSRVIARDKMATVFDVGANVGQTSLHYQEEFPQADIYAFEPVSATHAELVRATAGHSRIRPQKCAMGSQRGAATINVSSWNTNSSILHGAAGGQTETISVDTIADFCMEQKIETIDLLKMDTEGYELEVLAGARPLLQDGRVNFIYTECEPFPTGQHFVTLSAIGEFLRPLGYELFGIYDQTPYWNGKRSLYFFNAVFISPKLVAPPSSAR